MKGQFKRTAIKEAKRSRFRLFFLNLGRLVLDVAKLCFGSLVLGTVIKGQIPQATLLNGGIIASVVGALGGIILVTACKEE